MAGKDGQVTLRDRRVLSYAEFGYPRGHVVFYFHGTPGCRLEGDLLDEAARLQGVRLIAFDRPGYGRSDFDEDRSLANWPGDVAELADALGVERFSVIGLSGGGPHALATAALLPERVEAAAIVSGAGSREAQLARRGAIGRFFTKIALAMTPLFAWYAAMWAAFWAPRTKPWMLPRFIDRKVMKRPDIRERWVVSVRESLRQGGRAMRQDLLLFARDWGFDPRDASAVPVLLWHGDDDKIVPVSVGRYFASEIAGCQATFLPGEGHLLIVDHASEILAALVAAAKARAETRA